MTEPDFRKTFFPAENAGNMPEKPVFWHFLEISSLISSDLLHKNAFYVCAKHSRVRFLRKNFSDRKCWKYAGNCRFCRFSYIYNLCLAIFLTTYCATTCFLFCSVFDHHLVGPLCILLVIIVFH